MHCIFNCFYFWLHCLSQITTIYFCTIKLQPFFISQAALCKVMLLIMPLQFFIIFTSQQASDLLLCIKKAQLDLSGPIEIFILSSVYLETIFIVQTTTYYFLKNLNVISFHYSILNHCKLLFIWELCDRFFSSSSPLLHL